ncbi:MAG: T9SS type A sorting domain-containing protein, partial [Chitinophagaceae bacterium]|nr:T9SS type A sorting domain-containing protein [Chitinophagaceae bacterium]
HITDQLGRVLISQQVKNDATLIEVNTSRLASGVYFYRLDSGFDYGTTKSMEVVH